MTTPTTLQPFIPASVATLITGYGLRGFATALQQDGVLIQLYRSEEGGQYAVDAPVRALFTYAGDPRVGTTRSGQGVTADFRTGLVERIAPWDVREGDVGITPDGFNFTVSDVLPVEAGIQAATFRMGDRTS